MEAVDGDDVGTSNADRAFSFPSHRIVTGLYTMPLTAVVGKPIFEDALTLVGSLEGKNPDMARNPLAAMEEIKPEDLATAFGDASLSVLKGERHVGIPDDEAEMGSPRATGRVATSRGECALGHLACEPDSGLIGSLEGTKGKTLVGILEGEGTL